MQRSAHRISAALAVITLSFGGFALPAGIAFAAPVGGETAPAAATNADTINAAATTTLNIHKILGDPGKGTGQPGLAGVTFHIQKITNVDLTTQAGWDTLSGYTATTVPAGNLGTTTDVTTDANGLATTSDLGVGAFVVTEVQKQGYSVAPPFIVTLPHGETGAWNYTQDVYPKNQNVTPDKQVNDNAATIGEALNYTVNAPVPAGNLTTFVVSDPLVTNLTPPAASAVTVTASDTDGGNPVTLTGDDYTVAVNGQTVTVTFTDAGRTKLQAARVNDSALQAHVAFPAVVNSLPASGQITNTANVTIPGGTVNTDTPTGPTSTTFAPLTITKEGPSGTAATDLTGATFQLYQCVQDGGSWQLRGSALEVATTTTGTPDTTLTTAAGDDGTPNTAQGYGVPVSSYAGGATGTVGNTYCVLETKAPAGFVRNPQPQPVTYNQGTPGTFTVSVVDQKDTILNQLPATGAWGLLVAMMLGGGLVLRGVIASRRRRDEQHA